MREFSKVYAKFWFEADTQSLPVDAKLLMLYCISCSHANSLGCYRLPLGYMAVDLQWSQERVEHAMTDCQQAGCVLFDGDWVFIPRFLSWHPIENGNIWKHIDKLLNGVPQHLGFYKQLIEAVLLSEHISAAGRNRLETLSKGFESVGNTADTGVSEPFRNKEKEIKKEKENKTHIVNSVSTEVLLKGSERKSAASKVVESSSKQPIQPNDTAPVSKPIKPKNNTEAIEAVFSHWQRIMARHSAKLDYQRRRIIHQALQRGFGVDALCKAIDGCKATPFYMGENDRGQRYDGLHVILRDAERIEQFVRYADDPPLTPDQKRQRKIETWLNQTHEEASVAVPV